MLYARSYSFSKISLNKALPWQHLAWQGSYLLVQASTDNNDPEQFYQIAISGSSGIVSGPVDLDGRKNKHVPYTVEFGVYHGTIVQSYGPGA